MKIVLEQEIVGTTKTTRSCICIYDSDRNLISSYWLNDVDDPYNAMKITKALLESCITKFGWD
jgi:hypothetical protein